MYWIHNAFCCVFPETTMFNLQNMLLTKRYADKGLNYTETKMQK